MLAVLKLLAWEQRHGIEPRRDSADLLVVLRSYLDAGNDHRICEVAGRSSRTGPADMRWWLPGRARAARGGTVG